MTRIHKEYKFNFNNPLVKAQQVVFSSYPATLASNDDYYVTSQKLAVIETSIVVFNSSLYKLIKPQNLLCWQRVVLANRLADSAPEWAKIFATYNSGTYNNQVCFMYTSCFKKTTQNRVVFLLFTNIVYGFRLEEICSKYKINARYLVDCRTNAWSCCFK